VILDTLQYETLVKSEQAPLGIPWLRPAIDYVMERIVTTNSAQTMGFYWLALLSECGSTKEVPG
jgi:hypothetical protein